MESLEEAEWDIVLTARGRALSRSGKKVLHVDRNDFYGGTEAALSLQEIETWVDKVNDATRPSPFRNAILQKDEPAEGATSTLGFSRAYSISLSPQLIYTRSNLLPALVSSKVHSQLEFLAVGSWWIYGKNDGSGALSLRGTSTEDPLIGELKRIPGGREDIFSDQSIDLRSSRSLMKFLKLAADPQNHSSILEIWGSKPLPEYLSSEFKIPELLQAPLLALTASLHPPRQTLTSFALPRIHQHLTSIGLFGPGFGAVLPKWGGLSEIAQVGCRAGAVGGGVYVLNKGVEKVEASQEADKKDFSEDAETPEPLLTLRLEGGEEIKARIEDIPPVYLTIHSSDTGECPIGQDTMCLGCRANNQGNRHHLRSHLLPQPHASTLLTLATKTLLKSLPSSSDSVPSVLWTLHYTRFHNLPNPTPAGNNFTTQESTSSNSSDPHHSPPFSTPGLSLDDSVLKSVREAWARINSGDDGSFMLFEERADLGEAEAEGEDEDDDEDGKEEKEKENQSLADDDDAGGYSDKAQDMEGTFGPSGSADDSRRNEVLKLLSLLIPSLTSPPPPPPSAHSRTPPPPIPLLLSSNQALSPLPTLSVLNLPTPLSSTTTIFPLTLSSSSSSLIQGLYPSSPSSSSKSRSKGLYLPLRSTKSLLPPQQLLQPLSNDPKALLRLHFAGPQFPYAMILSTHFLPVLQFAPHGHHLRLDALLQHRSIHFSRPPLPQRHERLHVVPEAGTQR
ncbi:GDP dissociation inhibitor [Physcia stellaris]|nr:GDP dissociation inhibitor [Physcia stellaris]